MKKLKGNLWLMVLAGVLLLGIGYASISNVSLSINGSATANGNATNEDFKVRFVKFDSNDDEYVANATSNAAVVKTTNGINAANVTLDVTGDRTATFGISEGFDEIGDYVTLEYNVVNESVGIPAYIYIDVENESNSASDYFRITKDIEDNELSEGEVTKVTVKVELIARPKLDIDASFTVSLTAGDTEEETTTTPVVTYGATLVAATSSDTHKGIVYMDPSDLTTTCTLSDVTTNYTENGTNGLPTGVKTGCMKFYIFDDSGDTYKMILDHNTTAKVAYETSGTYKEYEEASIKSTVYSDTTGWVGSPRLITANEIATITNTTTFDGSSSTYFYFNGTGDNKQTKASSSQGDNEYAWLFDYTNGCTSYGCNTNDSSNYGYWTSSPTTDISRYGWYVHGHGSLDCWGVSSASFPGVRPVITIDKSIID